MANDENFLKPDDDDIKKRLNKYFESRLDLDRVRKTLSLTIWHFAS